MRSFSRTLLALAALSCSPAGAGTPSDDLLGLVPPDAGLTLVVSDLRGHSREVLGSPLVARLRELPAVRAWRRSEKGMALTKSRAEIESALGVSLATLRDDLLGDALVLALHVPADRPVDEPAGLLLTRVRDRKALERLIAALNAAETAGGILTRVAERPGSGGSPTVWQRDFAPGTKPDEWYAILPDDTFAWSNSESLLRAVFARRQGGSGLGASPRLQAVRDALPADSLARLYVDPRFLMRMARSGEKAGAPPADPAIRQVLDSMDYAGAALLWRDGLILRTHETFEPSKVPAVLRVREAGESEAADALRRVPRSALIVASWRWDAVALFDFFLGRIPEGDRPRTEMALLAAKGMLLGKDLRREIFPDIAPAATAFLDTPVDGVSLTGVLSLGLAGRREVADAIDNGLRTVLALAALDTNRKGKPIRVATADRDGIRVTTLEGAGRPWSFAATPDAIAIGSGPDIVRRELAARAGTRPGAEDGRIGELRRAAFPKASGFVAADLEAIHRAAMPHREVLARLHARSRGASEADVRRDLDRALELIEPFGGAFAAWEFAPDARSASQVFGLVGRSMPKG